MTHRATCSCHTAVPRVGEAGLKTTLVCCRASLPYRSRPGKDSEHWVVVVGEAFSAWPVIQGLTKGHVSWWSSTKVDRYPRSCKWHYQMKCVRGCQERSLVLLFCEWKVLQILLGSEHLVTMVIAPS